MDDCVGYYDACGVCNGGGVDADADGVCDNMDPCVGVLDACDVCNGPGLSFPVIEEIIFVTDSIYVPPIEEWYVFSYAVDTLFTYVCPVQGCTDLNASNFNPAAVIEDGSCSYSPAQCNGASTVTFDGHTYPLVGIGTQCWFKENLRSDNYRNGDVIPGNLNDSLWISATFGAQAIYGEGASTVYQGSGDEGANLDTFGRLYNWYAVNDARGLCPVGFHVPSDSEWMTLEMALGMSSAQANGTGWRGTDQGSQLKVSSNDSPPWNGINSSGFSALPGGARYTIGYFNALGGHGFWWSSTPSETYAWIRSLNSGYSNVDRSNYNVAVTYGFSVRCVRDEGVFCLDPDNDGVCAENEISGCTDINATNFNPIATEEDGTCVMPGPAQCGGVSTVTFYGHTYALVGIGNQCWFKENLRSDNYRNGDAIQGNLNDSEWTSTVSGAQTVYNNDPVNLATYGRLYNWYAVNDARGLCPAGFHVPTDGEWMTLEVALGLSLEDAYATDYRGWDVGKQLKSSLEDNVPWTGSNTSGFSGIPGGSRSSGDGNFSYLTDIGTLWSATEGTVEGHSFVRALNSGYDGVYRSIGNHAFGFSVRCIKD